VLTHRGNRLESVQSLIVAKRFPITNLERKYINACVVLQQKSRLRYKLTVAVLSVLLLAAVLIAIYALRQQDLSRSTELAMISMNETTRNYPEAALFLATEAASSSHTLQTEEALRQALVLAPRSFLLRGTWGHTILDSKMSPDGALVARCDCLGAPTVWDATNGRKIADLSGHQGWVRNARFSRDSRLIVTSGGDGTARIWEAGTGVKKGILRGHAGPVWTAVFSDDGKYIATAGFDGTARVWDTASQTQVAQLNHSAWVRSVAFSSRGDELLTSSVDGLAWIPMAGLRLTARINARRFPQALSPLSTS
jgi:hypothetical protein